MADVTVDSLGGLGDGIATYQDKPLFISKSCIGDRLRVQIAEETAEHFRGNIIDILSPGEHRIAPPCTYYGLCGGCSLQHLSAEYYQQYKRRNFASALRQAGFPDHVGEMVFLPAAARRRVEFKWSAPETKLSYYRGRSHDLVPVDHCLILEPSLQALMEPLARALASIPAPIQTVSLTLADSGIDLVIGMPEIFAAEALKSMAKSLGIARITLALPDGLQPLAEFAPVEMQLGKYRVKLPANAFLQAAREAQKLLTDFVLKSVNPGTHVADLFCGIGTYGFPLADICSVHAVETDDAMIKALDVSIRRQNLSKSLSIEKRDLFKRPLKAAELNRFDSVIINPPRLGAKKQCEELAKSSVDSLIMVSCNPATWVRDVKILKKKGFILSSAMAIDQFVYSPHIEIASRFTRSQL